MFNMDHTRGNSSRFHYRLEYVMDIVMVLLLSVVAIYLGATDER